MPPHTANPGASESCNGLDDDCDGSADESPVSDGTTWWRDADADGYGTSSTPTTACTAPAGYVDDDTDCNDRDATVHPGVDEVCDGADNDCDGATDEVAAVDAATWYRDADGDGYGTSATTTRACTEPTGYVSDAMDCDDRNDAIHPGAHEVCDGDDNDCNGLEDDDADDATLYYQDGDADGYGTTTVTATACALPAGYSATAGDCDDTTASIHPGATETCDGRDQDCDSAIDDGATDSATWYTDADGDGFGNPESSRVVCTPPTGTVSNAEDCDDRDAAIHPGADEVCDGDDNDCDGVTDESSATDAGTWYRDSDADGYGLTSTATVACTAPTGYASVDGDCDDSSASVRPGAAEACDGIDNDCDGTIDDGATATTRYYADADGDTYGDVADWVVACTAPAGMVDNGSDCNDATAAVHPGATEFCDGIDNNCDSVVDEYSAFDAATWYRDVDSDGYGTTTPTAKACTQPAGYVSTATDCDDADATVYPGATETCDGDDDDCDGSADEGAVGSSTWYLDADGDNFGVSTTTATACSEPAGYTSVATDCDDTDATIFPGAGERCDGADNDCDGYTDEGASDATVWYLDLDDDTYGGSTTTSACDPPVSYVALGGDCNDSSASIYPGATEACDGYDNDCDGSVDEVTPTWYRDADGDGFGNAAVSATTCTPASDYVSNDDDCNDANAAIHPDADEVCGDSIDNDCDGSKDGSDSVDASTWYADTDGDGYGDATNTRRACTVPSGYGTDTSDCDDTNAAIHPAAPEICDGEDNNCDGAIEDALLVPGDYSTISAAISAATSGDTICVGAGYYNGPVDYNGKNISIEGAGSDLTFIDVNGGKVTFDAGETASAQLMGVTLWGGNKDIGSALYCLSSKPTLQDVVFEDNDCTSFSSCNGIAYFNGCDATLTDVAFVSNKVSISGSVVGGLLYAYNSDLTIDGLEATSNTVAGSFAGGLFSLSASNGTWENLTLSSNTVSGSGNGGLFYLSGSSPTLKYAYVASNTVSGSSLSGGLFYVYSSSDPTLRWFEVLANTVTSTSSVYGGILLAQYSSDPKLYNSIFAGNRVTASTSSGYAYGGLFQAKEHTSITNANSTISQSWVDVVGNTITAKYVYGGVYYMYTYADSSSTDRAKYNTGIKLEMVNVVSNTSSGSVSGSVLYDSSSSYDTTLASFAYNNFYGNTSGEFFNYTSPVGSGGNMSGDPLYVDRTATSALYWDLSLQATSPVRNAGNPGSAYMDVDGTYSAIGAYGGPNGGW